MIYWIYLSIGIFTEVIGTTIMRALIHDNPILAQVVATVGISFSYYFVSKAVIKIPICVSYAVWSGVGLAGIAILSAVLFAEPMPKLKILGLFLVGLGMVVLNLEKKSKDA